MFLEATFFRDSENARVKLVYNIILCLTYCTTRINFKSPRDVGWSLGGAVVIKLPVKTKVQFCQVPRTVGFKSQPFCDVRIKLAIGSLPYSRKSGAPTLWYKGVQPLLG